MSTNCTHREVFLKETDKLVTRKFLLFFGLLVDGPLLQLLVELLDFKLSLNTFFILSSMDDISSFGAFDFYEMVL